MLLSVLGTFVAKSSKKMVHNLIHFAAHFAFPVRGTSRIDMHSVCALCTWASWARLSMHVSQSIGWLWGLSQLVVTAFIAFCYSSRFPPLGSGFGPKYCKTNGKTLILPSDLGPFWSLFWGPRRLPKWTPKWAPKWPPKGVSNE